MIDQIAIALTGVTAVYLSQDKREEWRRWSSVLGLLGQPFWFYATWKAEQWGIFVLCFFYAASWARGFWTYWLRDSALICWLCHRRSHLATPAGIHCYQVLCRKCGRMWWEGDA